MIQLTISRGGWIMSFLLNIIVIFAFVVFGNCIFIINNKRTFIKQYYIEFIVFFALTFIICLHLSLSPFNNRIPGIDSSVFINIGRRMRDGFIPYKDSFDHKGIILYFIEYIGFLITPHSFTGIWLIEFVTIFFSVYTVYLISTLFTENRIYRLLSLIIVMYICGMRMYEGGNLTEEYALPWIAYSLYIFLKYFKTHEYKIKDIFIVGIAFAVVLLLRVNMVVVWAVFLPIILVRFIAQKEYKDILYCSLTFLSGIVVVFVPTLVYLLLTHSFSAMIEDYILFNFSYVSSERSLYSILYACFHFAVIDIEAALAFIITFFFFRKDKVYLLNSLVLVISVLVIALGGRLYSHYAIILLPCFMILFLGLFELTGKLLSKFGVKKILLSPILIIVAVFVTTAISFCLNYNIEEKDSEIVDFLKKETSQDDDVLVLGNSCYIYLYSNRNTNNKFFYQTPPINNSEKIYDEFLHQMEEKPSDFIVVPTARSEILKSGGKLFCVVSILDGKCSTGEYEFLDYDSFSIYKLNN